MASASPSTSASGSIFGEPFSVELDQLKKMHVVEREHLVLTKRPITTLKFFTLATVKQLGLFWTCVAAHKLAFAMLILLCLFSWITLFTLDGPHEKFLDESLAFIRFVVWWVGLGVASSIGLGSGLHTFVLYLGPHIAMFTLKATLCGREDFKRTFYDTPQFGLVSTWANKDCAEIGPPKYLPLASDFECYMVPLRKILIQVQPEAILWGIGTALGELPPYFVSRAARQSSERLKELEDIMKDDATSDSSRVDHVKRIKRWLFEHGEQLGFFAILAFASVPNPVFDLAGIMCGQLSVPFWKFFSATLIGKALIKTHIQTIFIILVCNAHTLDLIEANLGWLDQIVPGFAYLVPQIRLALHNAKDNFRHGKQFPKKPGKFSIASVWNTIVLFMLAGFLGSIITSTAQGFLIEKQKIELEALEARGTLLNASGMADCEDKKEN